MVKLMEEIDILRIFTKSFLKDHFENQIISSTIFHNIYIFFTYLGLNKAA